MEKYRRALKLVTDALDRRGVEYVLVGSAVLPLAYGVQVDPGDVDLFILNKSTILDNELFEEIAQENDWDAGTTDHGTLYYELVVGGDVVRVDLLENILDIYIPPEFFAHTTQVKVDGKQVQALPLEALLVLKAKIATKDAEDFISEMARIVLEKSINIDYKLIKKLSSTFEDSEDILKRLRRNGIYVD